MLSYRFHLLIAIYVGDRAGYRELRSGIEEDSRLELIKKIILKTKNPVFLWEPARLYMR